MWDCSFLLICTAGKAFDKTCLMWPPLLIAPVVSGRQFRATLADAPGVAGNVPPSSPSPSVLASEQRWEPGVGDGRAPQLLSPGGTTRSCQRRSGGSTSPPPPPSCLLRATLRVSLCHSVVRRKGLLKVLGGWGAKESWYYIVLTVFWPPFLEAFLFSSFPFLCPLKLSFPSLPPLWGPGGRSLHIPVLGQTPCRIRALSVVGVLTLPSLPPSNRPRPPELFDSSISNELHSDTALLSWKPRTEKKSQQCS